MSDSSDQELESGGNGPSGMFNKKRFFLLLPLYIGGGIILLLSGHTFTRTCTTALMTKSLEGGSFINYFISQYPSNFKEICSIWYTELKHFYISKLSSLKI